MFRAVRPVRDRLPIVVDGRTIEVAADQSVAAAMLEAGLIPTRTTMTGAPRAPYCMIGNCFECLVEIDGVPNRQACLVAVRPGMHIRRQAGLVEVAP